MTKKISIKSVTTHRFLCINKIDFMYAYAVFTMSMLTLLICVQHIKHFSGSTLLIQ